MKSAALYSFPILGFRNPNPRSISIHSSVRLDDVTIRIDGDLTIEEGVTIAHDNIIFTNSVVTKSTKPNRTFGGIPVREIKQYNQGKKKS